jgi:NAD(P)-dependent dehydrogenase (short-subunit alcohol dehydrogenase family)
MDMDGERLTTAAPPVSRLLDASGKVALITGAGSGMGRGIAARFAEAGARVMVHYHASAEGAQAVVARITEAGGQARSHQTDLTRPEEVEGLIRATVDSFGRLDMLVNNAGIYPLASLLEMTPEQWETVLGANLRGVFLCTQAAARQMIAQGEGGAIVTITSIEAENPAPSHTHYDASKGGALMFTRAAALELGPHGIRVNAVAPGLMWTEGIEQSWADGVTRYLRAAPLGRLGMPEDVADACLFLCSPAARWITGASLTVDGGVMTHTVF